MTEHALNDVTRQVITAAIAVHSELGSGLLESTYEACLVHEMADRGLCFARQVQLPVSYRGRRIDCAYRVDLLVEGCLVVELKSVEALQPIHSAQMLTYLRLTGCPVGLLINFNVTLLKDGIRRLALTRKQQAGGTSPSGSSLRPLRPLR